MFKGSTNPLRKNGLDDVTIGTAITKASTDIFDTVYSLKEENDILIKNFKEIDAVIEEGMASAKHARDHKSISADMLSKI